MRKEKEAFEKLIKDKATMVIPEHREGRDNDGENEQNPDLARNLSQKASDPAVEALGKSSRKGFDECSATPPKVIVDMREFRSDLPSILHKRGIDIEPVTLEVGDYIITPEMCIERKSISDLIGSLQSGRLYNQATAMTRFYTKPMLLIEFDHNKSFALQGKYYLSRDAAANDLVARLQLLTIHFPKVFHKYYLFLAKRYGAKHFSNLCKTAHKPYFWTNYAFIRDSFFLGIFISNNVMLMFQDDNGRYSELWQKILDRLDDL